MCDPVSVIALTGAIGSGLMQYQQQQDLMAKQNQANEAWIAYQRRQSDAESARQEELRQQAEAARQGSLAELTADKQKAAQEGEQGRLTSAFTPQETADMAASRAQTLNDKLLSGQAGGAPEVTQNIKGQLAKAAQEARKRIAALAAVQSYGGSQFGLTNRANQIFNASGQNIRLAGDERQGSLGAYGVEKAVEPIHYVATPSGWGSVSTALAGAAGKRLGDRLATAYPSFGGSV